MDRGSGHGADHFPALSLPSIHPRKPVVSRHCCQFGNSSPALARQQLTANPSASAPLSSQVGQGSDRCKVLLVPHAAYSTGRPRSSILMLSPGRRRPAERSGLQRRADAVGFEGTGLQSSAFPLCRRLFPSAHPREVLDHLRDALQQGGGTIPPVFSAALAAGRLAKGPAAATIAAQIKAMAQTFIAGADLKEAPA